MTDDYGRVPTNLRGHAAALIPLVADALNEAQSQHRRLEASQPMSLSEALKWDAKLILHRLDQAGALTRP